MDFWVVGSLGVSDERTDNGWGLGGYLEIPKYPVLSHHFFSPSLVNSQIEEQT